MEDELPATDEENEATTFLYSAFVTLLAQQGYEPDPSDIDFSSEWHDSEDPYPKWDHQNWHADKPFAFVRFGASPIEFVKGKILIEGVPEDNEGNEPEINKATEAAIKIGEVVQYQVGEGEVLLCSVHDIHRGGKPETSGERIIIRANVKRILEK